MIAVSPRGKTARIVTLKGLGLNTLDQHSLPNQNATDVF